MLFQKDLLGVVTFSLDDLKTFSVDSRVGNMPLTLSCYCCMTTASCCCCCCCCGCAGAKLVRAAANDARLDRDLLQSHHRRLPNALGMTTCSLVTSLPHYSLTSCLFLHFSCLLFQQEDSSVSIAPNLRSVDTSATSMLDSRDSSLPIVSKHGCIQSIICTHNAKPNYYLSIQTVEESAQNGTSSTAFEESAASKEVRHGFIQ